MSRFCFPGPRSFLFRIIQEALSNVQKHAKADRVSVQLDIDMDLLHVTISDNGIGFDMEPVLRRSGKMGSFRHAGHLGASELGRRRGEDRFTKGEGHENRR